jgi:monofunctional chorismate mutase
MDSEINSYRSKVDQLDGEIVSLLKKRFQLARDLAAAKKRSGLPVMDHERELSILERVSAMSMDTPDRVNLLAVFRQILQESRSIQLKTSELECPPKRAHSQGRVP